MGPVALGQDPATPFLPFYFVEGVINTDLAAGLIDHDVIIYESDPRVIGAIGRFAGPEPKIYRLNIFDAQYYGGFNVLPGSTYRVAVPTGADDHGMDSEEFVLSGNGFDSVDLNLVLGGGDDIFPPEGTIPIGIERDGGGVRLTWDIARYADPISIYRMTGDGSGQFTNDRGPWGAPIARNLDTGSHTDGGVFAAGDGEAYYKAIETAREGDVAALLPTAWAVGKFDYVLSEGYNLVSLPLVPLNGTGIEEVFYDQLTVNDTQFFVRNDATGIYSKAQVIGGAWSIVSGAAPALGLGSAYWVRVPGERRVSALGGVAVADFSRTMYSALGGYNLFGWSYPDSRTLDLGGLPPRDTNEVFLMLDGVYQKVVNSGGAWTNVVAGDPAFGCVPGAGYWYRNRAADFDWTAPAP